MALDVKTAIVDRLVSRGCEQILRALGYAMPVQHDQAEAAPARWYEADTHPASAGSVGGAEIRSDPMETRVPSPCAPVLEEEHLGLDLPLLRASLPDATEELPPPTASRTR